MVPLPTPFNPFMGQSWALVCVGPPAATTIVHVSSGGGHAFRGDFVYVLR